MKFLIHQFSILISLFFDISIYSNVGGNMNQKVNKEISFKVLKDLQKRKIDLATACAILGVTRRQIFRLKSKLKEKDKYFKNIIRVSKRKPPNSTKEKLVKKIIDLYQKKYYGFSHTHFWEKLKENENINISRRTLTRILNREMLISPFAQKKTIKENKALLSNPDLDENKKQNLINFNDSILELKEIHNRVHHIEDFGALIQLDAREDYYFENEKITVHLGIDVASGEFVGAFIDKFETLWGYQNVLMQIVSNYGIPKCILTDNRTVFEYISKNSTMESKNTLIQFKFSCMCLGIKLQTTSVATYKAIIERGNGTFGRRLPQELRINKIKNIENANKYLINVFLKNMNSKFKHPYKGKNVFRKSPDINYLNDVIGNITRRIFDKGSSIMFNKEHYLAVIKDKFVPFPEKTKCLIISTFDKRLIIAVNGIPYQAVKVNDFQYDEEKQTNPNAYIFLTKNSVNEQEWFAYKRTHYCLWNYDSFNKYVQKEMESFENMK